MRGILGHTLAHEVTHSIKVWSEADYNVLTDYIRDALEADFDALVKEKMDKLGMSYAMASDEVIADGCEMLLRDSKALEKLAMENASLFVKVVTKVREFIANLRKAQTDMYGGNEELHDAALKLREALKSLEEVQEVFDNALENSIRNMRDALAEAENAKTRENLDVLEKQAEKEGLQLSEEIEERYADYDKPITVYDVEVLRSIGRKSINSFTSEDIQKAAKWAYKFYKELGTKSPFFRAWFGDWRANDTSPVGVAEIPQYVATNEARKQNRGLVQNGDTKWDIRISREGETNTISHSGAERFSEYGLSGIKQLIENAVLLDSEVHEHHSNNAKNDMIAFDHKLYALGKGSGGNIGLYKITVEEAYQDGSHPGNRKFHNLKYIEKVAEASADALAEKFRSGGSTMRSSTTAYTISDLYSFVKRFDKDFTAAHEVNPALLNEDGTPKVFYHGTADHFTEFLPGKRGANTGAYSAKMAFFFTDSESVASGYASDARPQWIEALRKKAERLENAGKYDEAEAAYSEYENAELAYKSTGIVMPVYLSLTNPYVFDFNGSEYREQTYYDILKKAKAAGHDGVIFTNTFDASNRTTDFENNVCAVFDSSSIKSATDNIGTFDGANGDIYFSEETDSDSSAKTAAKLKKEIEKATRLPCGSLFAFFI